MHQHTGKKNRRKKQNNQGVTSTEFTKMIPLNSVQDTYLNAIKSNTIIFGSGSAGTGKTFVPASYAAEQLYRRNIDKIILTRPNQETGESMGHLPGELDEKFAPYLVPFQEVFTACLGSSFYRYCLKSKNIDPRPLGYLRGVTFNNCIVLADEMQNATVHQTKMLLSRIGDNCTMIITGDPDQFDIRNSGFQDAISRLKGVKDVEVITFTEEDIVRSEMCKNIIKAYKRSM